MAWETGTASGHDDLLDKLLTFITTDTDLVAAGQEWTVLSDVTTTSRLVYIRGPGLANNDEIFLNIERFYESSTGAYNWGFRGHTAYSSSLSRDDQPGTSENTYLCLSNAAGIVYWFIANGRRIIIIAKIGTVFVSAYVGFFLPYATPSEYPYPMCIGASTLTRTVLYTDGTSYVRAFWKPNNYTTGGAYFWIKLPSGVWTPVRAAVPTGTYVAIFPYCHASHTNAEPIGTGEYTPLEMILWTSIAVLGKGVFGSLQGAFHVPGTGLNSEDTLDIGGVDYLAVQNGSESGQADYAVIALE